MSGLDYRINEVDQLTVWQVAVALGRDKPTQPATPITARLDDDTADWVMAQFVAQRAGSADVPTGS